MISAELSREGDVAGPLKRQGISHGDHPLSVGKASAWDHYFKVNLSTILRCLEFLVPRIADVHQNEHCIYSIQRLQNRLTVICSAHIQI